MDPVLKWAGGKRRMVEPIREAFGGRCEGTYFEPFVGSGAIYLAREDAGDIQEAVLSDINPRLINFWKMMKTNVDDVLHELSKLPKKDWKKEYAANRKEFNEGNTQGPRAAALFLWINRSCFNGLYRENKRGDFNVPPGDYEVLVFPSDGTFKKMSKQLNRAIIRRADFRTILEEVRIGDQVYADPPYVPQSKTSSFTSYSQDGFGHADQMSLAEYARKAAWRGGVVVLSNHDLPIVRTEIYPMAKGFVAHEIQARRSISCRGDGRSSTGELIVRIGPESVGGQDPVSSPPLFPPDGARP